VKRKSNPGPPAVSPAWREPKPSSEPQEAPRLDPETEAIRDCDRPGLEGGVNFFDHWRAESNRYGFGDDGL
jgi:hypothetical protein